jgi:diadenosine tetraphosphatase ApaH/serine/threonine PP2A family protein phosphatase
MIYLLRYLVVTDLHGNWPALEAILREAKGYDDVLFLGDAVGYYPDSNRVLDWLRAVKAKGVLGNHDFWLLKIASMKVDSPVMEILNWQAQRISPENREYLKSLPWTLNVGEALLVHGSPLDPLAYLEEVDEAKEAFAKTTARWIFHGHTHVAGAYLAQQMPTGTWVRFQRYANGGGAELMLSPKVRVIVNPGSVGQPRDGITGAAYCLWDPEEDSVSFHRPKYNLEQVLTRIHHEKFPMWLYERLVLGK